LDVSLGILDYYFICCDWNGSFLQKKEMVLIWMLFSHQF